MKGSEETGRKHIKLPSGSGCRKGVPLPWTTAPPMPEMTANQSSLEGSPGAPSCRDFGAVTLQSCRGSER